MLEIQEKKYLVPTTRGLAIYDGVKNLDLSKPDVTGEWECKLNKIAEGSFNAEAFIEEIKDKAVSLIKELDKVIINVEMENIFFFFYRIELFPSSILGWNANTLDSDTTS